MAYLRTAALSGVDLRERPAPDLQLPPDDWSGSAPDFVGVGVQKAGTSWWYHLVVTHPEITDLRPKEMHYFNRFWEQPFTSDCIDEYHSYFPRPAGSLAGEWSPRYMHEFWVPPLLAAAAPDAKVLVILRDPIERYRSGLSQHLSLRPRDTWLPIDSFERGLYARQLERLLSYVDRSRVLMLQYERCVREPGAELQRTYRHLGVDASFVPADTGLVVNKTDDRVELDDHLLATLRQSYAADAATVAGWFPEIDTALWPTLRSDG